MTDRDPISSVDTAWLRMERPTNLMMVTSVCVFRDRVAFADVVKLVDSRFLSHARFRKKAVQDNGTSYWETDTDFDIARHVHRVALPGAAGKDELEELISDLISTPLDFSKPGWQFHLVENYRHGSALIIRIHHSYADGFALVRVLLSMTNTDLDSSGPAEEQQHATGTHSFPRMYRPMFELVGKAFDLSARVWEESKHLLHNPTSVMDYVNKGWGLAGDIAKIATLSNDPKTSLKGKLGVSKRVGWTLPLSLEEIKAVGTVLGCTVNDVLLSCVAGALGEYLEAQGDFSDKLDIRALVPVNLKSAEDTSDFGNRFGVVFLTLPLGIANPLKRLYQVSSNMEELKESSQAVFALMLLTAAGMGPNKVQESILDVLTDKASAVITNVPGPQTPLYMAGSLIDEMVFWVPQAGHIGVGISILSYNGRVQIGLMADTKLVGDPSPIVKGITAEFERLLLAVFLGVPQT